MCKFIGKSNERILCKLSKSEILWLYLIVHVAMETTKTSNFTCQSKSFISILFTCHDLACELQPFSCHDLINDIHSQTARQNCVQPPETMSRSYSRLIIYLRDVLLHTFISIRRHFGNQKGTEAERHIAIVSGIVTGVVTQLDVTQRSPWESVAWHPKNGCEGDYYWESIGQASQECSYWPFFSCT